MNFSFELTRPQLKVFSAVSSNFIVIWIVAILATRDIWILIRDILLVILFWYAALRAEEALETL